MKKPIALIIAMLLLVSVCLSGCGSTETASESSLPAIDPNSPEAIERAKIEGELTIWGDVSNQSVIEDYVNALNARFCELYPNIKLNYQWTGSEDKMNIAVQSNSLPDLFWVQGNKTNVMAELANNGFLYCLDEFASDTSRFSQEVIDYTLVDGKQYCSFPGFLDYVVLYYNADIFAEYGISEPQTFDDFLAACETLKANGVTPLALGGTSDWGRLWPVQAIAASLANEDLSKLYVGNVDDTYPALAEAFQIFADMCAKGYFGEPVGAMDGTSSMIAFGTGKTAMLFGGTWSKDVFVDLGFDAQIMALPNKDGVRYAQTGFSNFNTFAMSANTKYPEAGYAYLEYLSSEEGMQLFEDYLGTIPVVNGINVTDPRVEKMANYTEIGKNIYTALSNCADSIDSNPGDYLLGTILPELMNGTLTGEQAVEKLLVECRR